MHWLARHRVWIVGLALVAGLAARTAFLPYESDDYHRYVKLWVRFIEANDGLLSLRHDFANYTQPYLYLLSLGSLLLPGLRDLYLIKLVSTVFDALCAALVWRIVEERRPSSLVSVLAFCAVWLSPIVILNSAAWGQVDSMFTAFLLLSVLLLMRDSPARGLAAYGAAIAIKLQSIFLLPLILAAALRSRARLTTWIPIVFIAAMLPAVALGKPVGDALFTYGQQIGAVERLTMGAPNWYQWLPPGESAVAWWAGMLLGAALMLVMLLCARRWEMPWPEQALLLGCWALAGVPFLLPRMHDRYFYPAEVFAIALAFSRAPKRPAWLLLPLALSIGSLCAYLAYLWQIEPVSLGWAAVPVALAVLALTITSVRAARGPAIRLERIALLDGLWPLRARREWLAAAIALIALAGAAAVGAVVRDRGVAARRIATFELDGARASIDRAAAYRCEGRVQIELTWADLANFGPRSTVSEKAHLYGRDGQRVAIADGYPGGKVPFNMLPRAFAEIRTAEIANPAAVSEARVGLYEVEGIRNFGAMRNDGAIWPDGAVVVLVRDARPGECERR